MRLKILDRYILLELFRPFLMALGGFIVFMIANILYLLAEQIVSKRVPLLVVAQMMVLRLPAILVLTFPVAMLFATILGLGTLAGNYEISALRTSGTSFGRILVPVLAAGLALSVITLITNEYIAPWATHQSENIVRRMILRQALPFVSPNVFIRGPENRVFYVGDADNRAGILYNVMIFDLASGRFPQIITARMATYDQSHWYLRQGHIHKYDAAGLTQYEVAFQKLELKVNIDPSYFTEGQKTPQEMSADELLQQINLFAKSGLNVNRQLVDLHIKFSMPASCLITCIIGAPLSVRFPRGGRMMGIALSIVIIFIYYFLISIFRAMGLIGVVSPILAAWAPNLFMGVLGALLVWQEDR